MVSRKVRFILWLDLRADCICGIGRFHLGRTLTGAQVAVRTISMNPYSALLFEDAHIFQHQDSMGQFRLPGNSSTPGFAMGFIVPDDHSPDSSLTVDILWETRLTDCFVVFASNYLV